MNKGAAEIIIECKIFNSSLIYNTRIIFTINSKATFVIYIISITMQSSVKL